MDNEITLHYMGWTLPNKSQIITQQILGLQHYV